MQWFSKAVTLFFLCAVMQAFGMRDPTRPPTEQLAKIVTKEDKRFVVNSILHASDRHHVVINGQVLKVGDTINGVKLIKIESHQVQLMEGATLIQISIYKKVKEPVVANKTS